MLSAYLTILSLALLQLISALPTRGLFESSNLLVLLPPPNPPLTAKKQIEPTTTFNGTVAAYSQKDEYACTGTITQSFHFAAQPASCLSSTEQCTPST